MTTRLKTDADHIKCPETDENPQSVSSSHKSFPHW